MARKTPLFVLAVCGSSGSQNVCIASAPNAFYSASAKGTNSVSHSVL